MREYKKVFRGDKMRAYKKVFRGDKMRALCCVQFLNRLHVILPDAFGNVHAGLQRLPPRFQRAGIINLRARTECMLERFAQFAQVKHLPAIPVIAKLATGRHVPERTPVAEHHEGIYARALETDFQLPEKRPHVARVLPDGVIQRVMHPRAQFLVPAFHIEVALDFTGDVLRLENIDARDMQQHRIDFGIARMRRDKNILQYEMPSPVTGSRPRYERRRGRLAELSVNVIGQGGLEPAGLARIDRGAVLLPEPHVARIPVARAVESVTCGRLAGSAPAGSTLP